MTVTETKSQELELATPAQGELEPLVPHEAPGNPAEEIVATSDHKLVGRAYLLTGLVGTIAALVVQALVALDGTDGADYVVLDSDVWFQLYTLAPIGVFFLGLVPALVGLAIYVVPLQVGAHAVAFPRAVAASFWTWLVGAALVVVGYAINGGLGGGDVDGVLLSYSGWGLVIVSLLVASGAVMTTVLTLRTEGMTLLRTPLFAWSMLVAGSVWLLTLPVLGANLILMYLDADHGALLFGDPALAWPQVRWVFFQPAVFALAIPVLGIAADAASTVARHRLVNRNAFYVAIGAFGVLSFGPWAQTAFNPRLVNEAVYAAMTFVIGVPLLALLGGLADTVRRGRPRAASPLPLGFLAILAALAAGVASALNVIEPLDLKGTVWSEGIWKLVAAAAVLGLTAGLFYWGPKIWGTAPTDAMGKLNVLVLLAGAGLFGAGDLLAGGLGQLPYWPTGIPEVVEDGTEAGQYLVLIGAAALALGLLLTLGASLSAAADNRRRTPDDPWEASTLEWSTSSPPPFANFETVIPPVRSAEPLADARVDAASVTNGSAEPGADAGGES